MAENRIKTAVGCFYGAPGHAGVVGTENGDSSLCHYLVRNKTGIEGLVNLINIAYCAMKVLPYQEKEWNVY